MRLVDLENEQSELIGELETRKLVKRSKGILECELGLSEPEAYQAFEHQSQEKKRALKAIARAIILSAAVKPSIVQSD